ncbi:MAG: RNA chaperone Hfq [Clostridia bacterium]|jgi:RNA chaperone Hfq|nr:RNA chaperone Hfq [Clostridia bacterium]
MENKIKSSLQDTFLNEARRERMPLTVFLTNGFQQKGVITAFDGFTVLLHYEGKQYLVYKHAISTIIPQRPLRTWQEDRSERPPSVRSTYEA